MTASERAQPSSAGAASDVLIVGGYGNVGQRIARLLAEDFAGRVLIGGRHVKRATRFAAALEGGATARFVDIDDKDTFASALEGVVAVLMCLDATDLAFPHACVTRGIHYLDISASYEVIERLGFLQDLASAHQATILCSVGLAPGLTNLLAKACVKATDRFVPSRALHLLFGLGDRHGKAALEWMVDRLHRPFPVGTGESTLYAWPFEERSSARFPQPFGERATYRFDFSEQHTLLHTLGVPSAGTWTTYDREWLAHQLARLARLGVLRWTRYSVVRRLTVLLLGAVRGGSDRFALVVNATTDDKGVISATASGREQARATAVIAAQALVRVLAQSPPAGVYQLDELYDLADFDAALAAIGIEIDAPTPVNRNTTHLDRSPPSSATAHPASGAGR